jgi:hypothetical protein
MCTLTKMFMDLRNRLGDREYLIYTVAFNIAPTIYGVKPGTILNFSNDASRLYELWNIYRNEFIRSFKISHYEIMKSNSNQVILFYNKEELEKALFSYEAMSFLSSFGYSKDMNLEECLNRLKNRFVERCPHEMGIFLGIPVEDVKGFLENGGNNFLKCGYWKVYSNCERAERLFSLYDQSKLKVLSLINSEMLRSINCH